MGTRQIRIFQAALVQEREVLLHKELQVISVDGKVVTGFLEAFTEEGILILRNGRGHLHRLPVAHVQEVVLDVAASQ